MNSEKNEKKTYCAHDFITWKVVIVDHGIGGDNQIMIALFIPNF